MVAFRAQMVVSRRYLGTPGAQRISALGRWGAAAPGSRWGDGFWLVRTRYFFPGFPNPLDRRSLNHWVGVWDQPALPPLRSHGVRLVGTWVAGRQGGRMGGHQDSKTASFIRHPEA